MSTKCRFEWKFEGRHGLYGPDGDPCRLRLWKLASPPFEQGTGLKKDSPKMMKSFKREEKRSAPGNYFRHREYVFGIHICIQISRSGTRGLLFFFSSPVWLALNQVMRRMWRGAWENVPERAASHGTMNREVGELPVPVRSTWKIAAFTPPPPRPVMFEPKLQKLCCSCPRLANSATVAFTPLPTVYPFPREMPVIGRNTQRSPNAPCEDESIPAATAGNSWRLLF